MKYQKLRAIALMAAATLGSHAFAQTSKGIDKTNFDAETKPSTDMYQHVNGNWLTLNDIPASEARWGSFNEVDERNRTTLKAILSKSATEARAAKKGADWQLVGDFYASGMDTTTIENLGIKPIEAELKALKKVKKPADVLTKLAHFHEMGVPGGFGFYITADEKDSKVNAAYLSQGGLGLPERSYYLEKTERFEKIRTAYTTHIANMLVLSGVDAKQATKDAKAILKLETAMATASRTPVENRDPQKTYNKKSTAELQALSPNMNWQGYFAAQKINTILKEVIVGQPEFFKAFSNELKNTNIKTWQAYLRWNLLRGTSGYLSSPFVDESFEFYGKTLRGTKVQRPRWKKIQDVVNGQVGEALGKLYVEQAFSPKAKERMESMIQDIRAAFAVRINNLDWMSNETKAKALIKLNAIVYKIGYPDKWRDYSSLDVVANDYIGNNLRTNVFDYKFMLDKLTQPVDKSEWGMTPPTVNAYYNPSANEIVFPAGILQPPFFDMNADDAVNYGGIGAVIAHELTHGFDDQGSQYDFEGNLKNWWTEEDLAKFKVKTDKIIAQFNEYTVLDTVHVNGALTVGENIADLGGVTIAFEALQRNWAKNGKPEPIDGLTPEQRFCISFAQIWRGKYRDQALLERIKTDPHSPGVWRANGTLSNFSGFYEAFDIKDGDPMKLSAEKRTIIW